MTHLGRINKTLLDNELFLSGKYPFFYAYSTIFAKISSDRLTHIQYLIPYSFSMFFFFSTYVLNRYILARISNSDKNGLALLGLFPFLGSGHTFFGPNLLAFYLIPIILLLIYKICEYKSLRISGLAAVFLLILPMWHPEVGIATSITLVVLFSIFVIHYDLRLNIYLPVLISLGSIYWIFQSTSLQRAILSFFSVINLIGSQNTIGREGRQADRYNSILRDIPISNTEIMELFIMRRGLEFLMIAFAFTFLILLVKNRGTWDNSDGSYIIWHCSLLYLFFGLMSATILLTDFVLTWSRFLDFSLFFSVILIIVYLSRIDFNRASVNITTLIILTLIMGLLVLSFYPSPLTRSQNSQVTENHVEAYDWAFSHSTGETVRGSAPSRFLDFLSAGKKYPPVGQTENFPPRLGYANDKRLGQNQTGIYVIGPIVQNRWEAMLPNHTEQWGHRPQDFERLSIDPTVSRVYHGGDSKVYNIN